MPRLDHKKIRSIFQGSIRHKSRDSSQSWNVKALPRLDAVLRDEMSHLCAADRRFRKTFSEERAVSYASRDAPGTNMCLEWELFRVVRRED